MLHRHNETTPAEDRRRSPRFSLEARITVRSEKMLWRGLSEDVSEGGLFVAMSVVPAVGERVNLRIQIGAEPTFQGIGRVQWHRTNAAGEISGCGVQFMMLERRAKDMFKGLLSRSTQSPLLVDV